jgi:hypothetical protein
MAAPRRGAAKQQHAGHTPAPDGQEPAAQRFPTPASPCILRTPIHLEGGVRQVQGQTILYVQGGVLRVTVQAVVDGVVVAAVAADLDQFDATLLESPGA